MPGTRVGLRQVRSLTLARELCDCQRCEVQGLFGELLV